MPDLGEAITAARQLLETAGKLVARFLFVTLGSDHPAFIEALAAMEETGELPLQVIVCPLEMTALSAAHGVAMLTRGPQ